MIFVKEIGRLLTPVRGRPFELKKKEEKEDDEQELLAFLQFSKNHRSCIFYGVL